VGLSGSEVSYEKNSGKEKIQADIRQSALTFNLTAVF